MSRSQIASGLLFLTAASLVVESTAHSCGDGRRVQCTAIQSIKGAPSSREFGKSAKGYPLCTPSGQKVMCLVDHGYHQCASGEEPCCEVGSPAHWGRSSTDDSPDIMCSPVSETKQAVSVQVKTEQVQVVLDDMDRSIRKDTANVFEGSYQPCMVDAYKQQFHHDWARGKGNAKVSLYFDPPKSGCYKIEEHHPGRQQSCASYLPRNAKVGINYCKGQFTEFSFNQAENGGQWNELGSLPFYLGQEGKFTMQSSGDEECSAAACFFLVDAFRLTWIGDSCPPPAAKDVRLPGSQPQLTQQKQQKDQPTQQQQEEQPNQHQRAHVHHSGVLTLALQSDSVDAEAVLQTLVTHKTVFEGVLQAKLGAEEVDVMRIVVAQGRRLQEAYSSSFDIHFQAHGASKPMDLVNSGLHQAIQDSFTGALAYLTVESASLTITAQDEPVQGSDSYSTLYLMMALAAAIGVAVGAAFSVLYCLTRKRVTKTIIEPATDVEAVPVNEDVEKVEGKVMVEDNMAKTNENWEIISASTDEPASESPVLDDCASQKTESS